MPPVHTMHQCGIGTHDRLQCYILKVAPLGKSLLVFAATTLAVSLPAAVVSAQEVPQPLLSAQFSFSNPGARSLGLGGAFVALADDATAATFDPDE